ncbi:MAG TPA: PaaI family thioesterase, partial [Mycobacteriales bacterium]|nr:PaaI family thioesterase [Mycobacteriales bacterium]
MALTEAEQQTRRHAIRDLMPETPFLKGLGVVFDRYEPDEVVLRLP